MTVLACALWLVCRHSEAVTVNAGFRSSSSGVEAKVTNSEQIQAPRSLMRREGPEQVAVAQIENPQDVSGEQWNEYGVYGCAGCSCPTHPEVIVIPDRQDKLGRSHSYATGMIEWPPFEEMWHYATVTPAADGCRIDFLLGSIVEKVEATNIRWMSPVGRSASQRAKYDELAATSVKKRALGLLTLDYAYSTQPGDVDDKRTFCTVDNEYATHYTCQEGNDDEFELISGMIKWLSFFNCGLGLWTDDELMANGMTAQMGAEMRQNFNDTLTFYLTNDKILSISADCGLFIKYQSRAEAFRTWALANIPGAKWKPLVFSTVKLAPLVSNRLKAIGNGIAFIPTSNEAGLTVDLWELLVELGVPEGTPHHGGHNPLTAAQLEARLTACTNLTTHDFPSLPGGILRVEESLTEMLWLDANETQSEFCEVAALIVAGLEAELKNATAYNVTIPRTPNPVASNSTDPLAKMYQGDAGAANPWRFRVVDGKVIKDFGNELAWGQPHKLPTAAGQFLVHFVERMRQVAVRTPDWPVEFILVECTEMPQYSNAFRAKFDVPVWDIHTLGTCLMVAVGVVRKMNPHDPRLTGSVHSITDWPEFGFCLDERGKTIVPKFGAKSPVLNYLRDSSHQLPDHKWDEYIPGNSEAFVGYGSEWNTLEPGTLPTTAWSDTDGGFSAFKVSYPNPWRPVEDYDCYHPPPKCNYTNFGALGLNA